MVGVGDELAAGIPVVGAPGLGDELGVGRGLWLMATVLSVPVGLSLLVEPWVHAWSDRADRRLLLLLSLGLGTLGLLGAAASPGAIALSLALAFWGVATGVACGVAQAELVARWSDGARAMTRWAIGTSLGDLAAPLAVGLLAAWGLGWRAALVGAAVFTGVELVVVALALRGGTGQQDEPGRAAGIQAALAEGPEPTLAEALGAGLRHRRLLAWVAALASCTLLDEIALMLGAIRLADDPVALQAELGALVLGDAVSLLLFEPRLRRWSNTRVLLSSAGASAIGLVGWVVFADTLLVGAPFAFLLGGAAALHWPLAKAAAYGCLPDTPGVVNALETLGNGVDVAAPVALGILASTLGPDAALLALLIQPAVVGTVAGISGMAGSDAGTARAGARESEPSESEPRE